MLTHYLDHKLLVHSEWLLRLEALRYDLIPSLLQELEDLGTVHHGFRPFVHLADLTGLVVTSLVVTSLELTRLELPGYLLSQTSSLFLGLLLHLDEEVMVL